MITSTAFREQPVLTGQRVRLEPLTPAVLEDYLAGLVDEVSRLTGTEERWWTRSRKRGLIIGLSTFVAAVAGVATWLDWLPWK